MKEENSKKEVIENESKEEKIANNENKIDEKKQEERVANAEKENEIKMQDDSEKINDAENGIEKSDIQRLNAHELYERYKKLGGNSYVHDHFEKLLKEGKI